MLTVLAWLGIASTQALAQARAPEALRGTTGGNAPPPALAEPPDAGLPPLGDATTSGLGASEFSQPANYGKPRKKRKNPPRNPPAAKTTRPLPLLTPYSTAATPGRRSGRGPSALELDADAPQPGPTVAVNAQPLRRPRPRSEADPYAPVGFGVGSLRLYPAIEGSVGYDSNPNRVPAASQGSGFARVDGALGLQSDWARHELKATLRGGYTDFFQVSSANRPDAAAVVDERIDITRDTAIDLQQRYTLTTQSPGSTTVLPTLPAGVATVGRPLVQSLGASAGVTQKFNRLSLSLRGAVDRTDYQDAKLSDGTVSKLSADNYNDYTLRGRAAYEATPGISPFVEVTASQRRHDQKLDNSASQFARDSRGLSAAVGSSFELSRLLTGEASIGYGARHYDDARLKDLRGLITDASLTWTPTPLTTVKLKAGTTLAETNTSGASGAVQRSVGVELSHALLRNLTLGASLSYTNTDYQGIRQTDQLFAAGLKAEYNLTRSVVLKANFTHERLKSTSPGTDYTANVFLLGLRLQQ